MICHTENSLCVKEHIFAARGSLQEYLAQGWQESHRPLSGCHHGAYSVLLWRPAHTEELPEASHG